jgi:type IV secretory pathway component VirB8
MTLTPPESHGQPYRLAIWLAGLSSALSIVLAALLVVSLAMNFYLWRTKRTEVVVAGISDTVGGIYHLKPLYQDATTFQMTAQSIARKVVYQRETIDLATETTRWGELNAWMTDELTQSFGELMRGSDGMGVYRQWLQRQKHRAVTIVTSPVVETNGVQGDGGRLVVLVEWDATDSERGTAPVTRRWTSTVTIESYRSAVRTDEAIINPYGMKITGYAVAEKSLSAR